MHFTSASIDEAAALVQSHHYSRRMPSNIQHCYAVRCDGGLFGDFGDLQAVAVISIPPTRWGEDIIELTRLVRLPEYTEPLTKLIAFSCQQLKRNSWNLVLSYADATQGHHGGIYQAAGWRYAGKRDPAMDGCLINGVFWPGRSLNSKYGTRSPDKLSRLLPGREIEPHYDAGKFLYWRALHVSGVAKAKRLGLMELPYPKIANAAGPMDAPASRRCEPGATPGGRSISVEANQ